ncbi:SOS response-associated peptidase [Clostridium oryzae]|uniref:Abasic site processing protein n=1 Tax=Clostridium oryzae TaxID=1450648 RepID=A0A1V4ILG7_9CLOT|nr:SOS response-associated peptidase [Clostridium oryzae]OPJ60595.1 putative SOS response-associated peptidase YedK [Clostridium oryzae]
MCGRYYVDDETSREIQKIVAELDKKLNKPKYKTGEIYPTNDVPILVAKNKSIEADILKWGFPNFKSRGAIINACSETIFEKKMFRESLVSRRCVVPASGFFEWNTNKEKIYFTPKDESIMYMAGVFNIYDSDARFVILTTGANSSISDVHNRMPLLLSNSQIESWIFDDMQTQTILNQIPYLLNRSSDFEQQTFDLF